jgi:diketogulonate reductase-like aldo/keto reductase
MGYDNCLATSRQNRYQGHNGSNRAGSCGSVAQDIPSTAVVRPLAGLAGDAVHEWLRLCGISGVRDYSPKPSGGFRKRQLVPIEANHGEAGPGALFDDQLAAMVKARDHGLIGGIGLSNVTTEHVLHALASTDIACVQNPMNLADLHSLPVLAECEASGIAFVPFFLLGAGFSAGNPVLGGRRVIAVAARLDRTPVQLALAWLLGIRPNILLIPGTASVHRLEENLAVGDIVLDEAARAALAPAG